MPTPLDHQVNNITDQAIHALVDAVTDDEPTLERVHLSFCDNLSVQAITHLLKHIPGITHLSLTGVSAFRDRQYQAFCRAPPAVSCLPTSRARAENVYSRRNSTPTSAWRFASFRAKAFPTYGNAFCDENEPNVTRQMMRAQARDSGVSRASRIKRPAHTS